MEYYSERLRALVCSKCMNVIVSDVLKMSGYDYDDLHTCPKEPEKALTK